MTKKETPYGESIPLPEGIILYCTIYYIQYTIYTLEHIGTTKINKKTNLKFTFILTLI